MTSEITEDKNYLSVLEDIKQKVKTAQIKAHLSVNKEMLILYWQIGQVIISKQEDEKWGTKVTRKLSEDLKIEFSTMKGLSYTNLRYMQRFYESYSDLLICPQTVGKLDIVNKIDKNSYYVNDKISEFLNIPWGHNREIIDKISDFTQRLWYAQQTIKNGWSRAVLVFQIESKLYERQANKEIKTNNFTLTLPEESSDLANEIFKDEYNFEFIDNSKGRLKERELEESLIYNVIKFLTELGQGFAFVGKQYKIETSDEEYYIDLLFYHLHLRSYIVIELKTTKFKPEYAGKMAFYLSQVDKKLKKFEDNDSIGIILCPKSSNIEAQETVNYITKPIGLAGYQLAENEHEIPKELKPLDDLKKFLS